MGCFNETRGLANDEWIEALGRFGCLILSPAVRALKMSGCEGRRKGQSRESDGGAILYVRYGNKCLCHWEAPVRRLGGKKNGTEQAV